MKTVFENRLVSKDDGTPPQPVCTIQYTRTMHPHFSLSTRSGNNPKKRTGRPLIKSIELYLRDLALHFRLDVRSTLMK